jgi:outer membrane protein TolC
MIKIYSIVLSCLLAMSIYGQDVMTPEEAVTQALENNFNIRIAKNDVLIAENNTDMALFGYRPSVTANGNLNGNVNNNITNFTSGETIVTGYGLAFGVNANVAATYNIIDPSRSVNLEQFKEQVELSDLQKQLTIQNNVANVLSAYYDASRAAANIGILREILSLSQDRLDRLQIQNEYGQANRLDILNAQVDIDRDSINIANARLGYDNALRVLSNTIGISLERTYDVETDIYYDATRSLDNLIATARERCLQLQLLDQNQVITELNYDIIDAGRKPVLGANATYSYNFNRSAPGSFFSSSRSDGVGVGLSISYNLYDGGIRKNQRQSTQLALESQVLQREQLVNDLSSQLTIIWHQFQNALYIIESEKSNVATAKVNFDRTYEQYQAGQLTSIEYRQAQVNLLNSENSLLNAHYDAKLLEIQMLLLSGQILD